MPTPSAMSLDKFMQNYQEYQNASSYAVDWVNRIKELVVEMQADPNYMTALTQAEREAMAANLIAAQQNGIVPVVGPVEVIPIV